MSYVHNISLCDYHAFQASIRELLSHDNQEGLRQRTLCAISRLRLRDSNSLVETEPLLQWSLKQHGAGQLPPRDVVQATTMPTPEDSRNWILVILAEYLYPSVATTYTWGLVTGALQVIGWERQETELLRIGEPLETLLPENSRFSVALKPAHANKAGWIHPEKAGYFYENLQALLQEIENFDVRQLPNFYDREDPLLIQHYQEGLRKGYSNMLANLHQAIESNLAIITSISLQS